MSATSCSANLSRRWSSRLYTVAASSTLQPYRWPTTCARLLAARLSSSCAHENICTVRYCWEAWSPHRAGIERSRRGSNAVHVMLTARSLASQTLQDNFCNIFVMCSMIKLPYKIMETGRLLSQYSQNCMLEELRSSGQAAMFSEATGERCTPARQPPCVRRGQPGSAQPPLQRAQCRPGPP
jgi:hypothetical protein